MSATAPVIADQLGKDFREGFLMRKKSALESVSFTIQEGEIFGFLGPNGAGKSTTLHVLVGFLRPSRGRALVAGRSPQEPEARRFLGFLPEVFAFDRFATGRGLLRRFDALSDRPVEGRDERVRDALEAVGMEEAASRRIGTYSKGMMQRIGLAQALLGDPDLLILDEPMSGMDPATRHSTRMVLCARRERGKTTLLSSHILADVEEVADRVLILDRGRKVAEGPIAELGEARAGAVVFRDHDPARFDPDLAPLGLSREAVPGEPDLGILRTADASAKNAALALLAAGGADIVSVTPQRAGLEEIFLELTATKVTKGTDLGARSEGEGEAS